MSSNPDLILGFISLPEAIKDYTLTKDLESTISLVQQFLQVLIYTRHAAVYEDYEFCLKYYDSVQSELNTNYPGIDAVFSDLKPLFEKATAAPAGTDGTTAAGGAP